MSKIQQAAIKSLCPTQLTVGMIEVEAKRKRLAALSPKDQQDFLEAHPMPVVIGPGKKLYITDHHHLARAALEAGVATGYFTVEADLASHGTQEFWEEMDKNQWVHPLDQNGIRHAMFPFRAVWTSWSMMSTVLWRDLCVMPGVMTRRPPPSRNSSGRIFSGAISRSKM